VAIYVQFSIVVLNVLLMVKNRLLIVSLLCCTCAVCSKKSIPKVFCHFLSSCLEFWSEIYTFF